MFNETGKRGGKGEVSGVGGWGVRKRARRRERVTEWGGEEGKGRVL
jgi:hypothetical protein